MSPEAERRIKEEILAKVIKEKLGDREVTKMHEALAMSLKIGESYIAQLNLRPLRPDREQAAHEIHKLFMDGFKDWSKDDLLFLCSWLHSCIAADQLFDARLIS